MQFIYKYLSVIFKVNVFTDNRSGCLDENTNYKIENNKNICKYYVFMILLSCKYYEKLNVHLEGELKCGK